MPESTSAWRLPIVLRELQFPAQKWMIQTAADLYGADVQTQIELQDLPEVIFNDIDEIVTAVENGGSRFVGSPPRSTSRAIGPQFRPHDLQKGRPRKLAFDF